MLRTTLTVAAFVFSAAAFSQPAARPIDCSKAKDPQRCEQRVAKAKDVRDRARKACEGRKGDEARECMRRETCAQAKDPAKCEARLKSKADRRAKMREPQDKK
jgi:hypothetical protein